MAPLSRTVDDYDSFVIKEDSKQGCQAYSSLVELLIHSSGKVNQNQESMCGNDEHSPSSPSKRSKHGTGGPESKLTESSDRFAEMATPRVITGRRQHGDHFVEMAMSQNMDCPRQHGDHFLEMAMPKLTPGRRQRRHAIVDNGTVPWSSLMAGAGVPQELLPNSNMKACDRSCVEALPAMVLPRGRRNGMSLCPSGLSQDAVEHYLWEHHPEMTAGSFGVQGASARRRIITRRNAVVSLTTASEMEVY